MLLKISKRRIQKIVSIVNAENIEMIVIGLPIDFNNQDTPKSLEVRSFASTLGTSVNVEIKLFDERYTTKNAQQFLIEANVKRKKKKERIDSLSAQIMLQGFLDSAK